ncbi:MAG: hypothetical protein M3Y34_05625, partial [Actinomycetota bacterium]|nr:hypothetical protein [Actinomycetota bacterium]
PDLPATDPASLVAGGPSDRFLPGGPERAPICASDHAMQVLYARPPGAADAFAASVPAIRSTVRRSNQVLNDEAIASGGGGGDYKVVCNGGGDVDVGQFTTTGTTFSQVVSSAKAAGFTSAARNYVVFLDASAGGVCGVGSLFLADSPGLSNPHNTSGGYAVIYKGCWNGTTFMHEVGHNRGAVQPPAPHSTGSGAHCNDGSDVMCYAPDGGDRNQSMTYPCRSVTLFDCGYDDYFDAAPEPGEYLASHWNLGTRGQNFLRITEATSPPEPADTAAPETSLTRGPQARSRKKSVRFEFEGTDDRTAPAELAFECSVDGGAFRTCLSPATYTVRKGAHRFQVRAEDQAGNADPTPAALSWKVRRLRR